MLLRIKWEVHFNNEPLNIVIIILTQTDPSCGIIIGMRLINNRFTNGWARFNVHIPCHGRLQLERNWLTIDREWCKSECNGHGSLINILRFHWYWKAASCVNGLYRLYIWLVIYSYILRFPLIRLTGCYVGTVTRTKRLVKLRILWMTVRLSVWQ